MVLRGLSARRGCAITWDGRQRQDTIRYIHASTLFFDRQMCFIGWRTEEKRAHAIYRYAHTRVLARFPRSTTIAPRLYRGHMGAMNFRGGCIVLFGTSAKKTVVNTHTPRGSTCAPIPPAWLGHILQSIFVEVRRPVIYFHHYHRAIAPGYSEVHAV